MEGQNCNSEESPSTTISEPITTLLCSTNYDRHDEVYACAVFNEGGVKWTRNPVPQVKKVLTDCVH